MNPTWSPLDESKAAFGPGSFANPPLPLVSMAAWTDALSPKTATLPSMSAYAVVTPASSGKTEMLVPLYVSVVEVAPAFLKAASNHAAAAVGSLTDRRARARKVPIADASPFERDDAGGCGPMLKASSPSNHALMLPVQVCSPFEA